MNQLVNGKLAARILFKKIVENIQTCHIGNFVILDCNPLNEEAETLLLPGQYELEKDRKSKRVQLTLNPTPAVFFLIGMAIRK